MRKNYLWIAAAAAMVAACTQRDLINDIVDEDVAIGFEGKYVNKGTRAAITNTWFANENENSFGVYGFKGDYQLFNNEQVTWDNTNHKWTNPTYRLWDKSATNYSFYAHAPYAATHTFNVTTKKYTFSSIPVIQDIDEDNADIVIATPITGYSYSSTLSGHNANDPETGASQYGHGDGHVEFDFNHILSKLSFKAYSSIDPDKAEIYIKKVQLDFPTGTSTWTQGDGFAGTTAYTAWVVTTNENGYKAKDGNYDDAVVFDGNTAKLGYGAANAGAIVDATTATNVAKTYIVTPVAASGVGTEHIFGIKVTYDVQYKKANPAYVDDTTTPDVDPYINDGDKEVNCVATGVIGGGDTAANQYKPNQNDSYVVTINVNPEHIEFCVDHVTGWTSPDVQREVTVQ
ncbi:MAG: hypothetical protein J6P66_07375 [Bacteroidaceae bacterium]|nr:hypothetical protein [Bacteroidaceae bacterium]